MKTHQKIDKYERLQALQDGLSKLFTSINFHPGRVPLTIPGKLRRRLDRIINRGHDSEYLEGLCDQIKQAAEIAEAQRLDAWSAAEEAKASEEKLKAYEKLLSEQAAYISQLEETPAAKESPAVQEGEKAEASSPEEMIRVITSLISMRDRQELKRDYLEGIGEEKGSSAYRIIEATLVDIARILQELSVEILDGTGPFSPDKQTAVATEITEDDTLVETVSATVRPGYCYRGMLLRSQEVIVYIKKA